MKNWPIESELNELFSRFPSRFARPNVRRPFEDEMIALMDTYSILPQDERFLITECLTESQRIGLIAFAGLMANRALNDQLVQRADVGLLALTCEGFQYDGRWSRKILSTLYHCLTCLGANPTAHFERTISYGNATAQRYLLIFRDNPTPIEDMWLALFHDDERGYQYKSDGIKRFPKPANKALKPPETEIFNPKPDTSHKSDSFSRFWKHLKPHAE